MEPDIDFGEVRETKPDVGLPPDEDPRYLVVPCGAESTTEPRIFVDLDAFGDMLDHADSNRSVELGGVILGRQLLDSQGRSFVVVFDSIRAEHYESTRGSFKFTHDTWSAITRRVEEYPKDTKIVGWYHTHPDWGVFLSGMDLFICEHFFRGAYDLALVIDPCREDVGWFVWDSPTSAEPKRTSGFSIYSSRFREPELTACAAALEGGNDMLSQRRLVREDARSNKGATVRLEDSRSNAIFFAILASMFFQTGLLTILAYRILFPVTVASTSQSVSANSDAEREILVARAERRVVERILTDMKGGVSESEAPSIEPLVKIEKEREEASQNLTAMRALAGQLTEERDALKAKENEATQQLTRTKSQLAELKSELKNRDTQIKTLEEELKPKKPSSAMDFVSWSTLWVLGGVMLLAGMAAILLRTGTNVGDGKPLHGSPLSSAPPTTE